MAAVQKTFGVLFLLVGTVLLLAGAGAAIYGALDQEDHEREQGPVGVGEDEDRTQANEALIVGGIVAAGLGLVFGVLGIVLLATSRPRPMAAEAGPGTAADQGDTAAPPGDGRPLRLGAITAAAGVAALLLAGFVLGGGAAVLGETDSDRDELRTHAYMGRLQMAGSLLGQSQGAHVEELQAPLMTRSLRVTVTWEPVDEQSLTLHVSLQVLEDGAWRVLGSQAIAPGGAVAASGQHLDGAELRVVVSASDQRFVLDQSFSGTVKFSR